jgi:hypothetical protein
MAFPDLVRRSQQSGRDKGMTKWVNRYRVRRAASPATSAVSRERTDILSFADRDRSLRRAAWDAKSSQRPIERWHAAISENLARTAYHVARGETVTPSYLFRLMSVIAVN